jgi:hypothetical protein
MDARVGNLESPINSDYRSAGALRTTRLPIQNISLLKKQEMERLFAQIPRNIESSKQQSEAEKSVALF